MVESTFAFPFLESDSYIYTIHDRHVLVEHDKPIGLVVRSTGLSAIYQVWFYLDNGLFAMEGLFYVSYVQLLQKAF
jgi:hypothetical protein